MLVTVTAIVCVSLMPPASATFTVTLYSLAVLPVWFGVSKSGALVNVSTPDDGLMVNLPPSSAGSNDHVRVSDASTSVAEKVATAVLFSGMLSVAGGDAITGASFTFVRLMVTVMKSSVTVFASPAASLLSRTFTVTV